MDLSALKPYAVRAGIVLAAVLVTGGMVWGAIAYLQHRAVVAEQRRAELAALKYYKEQVELTQAIAEELESNLAQARIEAAKLNQKLNHELSNNPVYSNCRVPADGVQLIQQALGGSSPR